MMPAEMTENVTETAEDTAEDLGLPSPEVESDVPPIAFNLTAEVDEEEAPEAPEAAAGADDESGDKEAAEAPESVLERVESQFTQDEEPQHPQTDMEMRERLASLEGRLAGRDERTEPQEPRGPSVKEQLTDPAVAQMLQEALQLDDGGKRFNALLVETQERLVADRVDAVEAKLNKKFEESTIKARNLDFANQARQTMASTVEAVSQFSEIYPAAAELAEDYRTNGTNSRLFKLWARQPTAVTDGQHLFTTAIGLAATYHAQGGLPANGDAPAQAPAPPATRDGSTGARPKRGKREAALNQPQATPEDAQDRMRSNVNRRLESVLGAPGLPDI